MKEIIIDLVAHFIFVCVLLVPAIAITAKKEGKSIKEELFDEE